MSLFLLLYFREGGDHLGPLAQAVLLHLYSSVTHGWTQVAQNWHWYFVSSVAISKPAFSHLLSRNSHCAYFLGSLWR